MSQQSASRCQMSTQRDWSLMYTSTSYKTSLLKCWEHSNRYPDKVVPLSSRLYVEHDIQQEQTPLSSPNGLWSQEIFCGLRSKVSAVSVNYLWSW